jgi:hypothetical protein
MAWRIQRFDFYSLTNLEGLAVLGRLCDCLAVLAADDGLAAELLELVEKSTDNSGQFSVQPGYHLLVPSGMIPMTVTYQC